MSIIVNSEDHISGTNHNGTWKLQQSVNGNFKVIDQYIDAYDFPWLFIGANQLSVADPFNLALPIATLTFPTQTAFDSGSVISMFQSVFQQLNDTYGYAITFNTTYDSSVNQYTITLNRQLQVNTDPTSMTYASTVAYAFNWVYKGPLFDPTGTTTIIIDATFFTSNPIYLEIKISESNTVFINPRNTQHTILLSTGNNPVVNQNIQLKTVTNNHLTIKLFRMENPVTTLPIPDQVLWQFILK